MEPIAGSRGDTIESLRAVAIAADPARPVLTWYDDATGERVELSGRTLDNWVAKTANLLVDGCGLGPGDRAAVALPPHWQTAAVLLGCWAAGLTVADAGSGDTGSGDAGPGTGADVIFAAAPSPILDAAGTGYGRYENPRSAGSGDRYLLGLAPMGLPLREVPAGWLDFIAEVRGHGDHFVPVTPLRPTDEAAPGLSHAVLVERARGRSTALGVQPGTRVLVDAVAHPDPVDWLLAPLAAGASIVLCGHLDPAALPARVAAERVDVALT